MGKAPVHASASSSEEEDGDDSDADAGSPALAERLRMTMETEEAAFYEAQDKFLQTQRELLKECPGTKERKLKLHSANLKPRGAPKTKEERMASMRTYLARETQLHGDEFGPKFYEAGAANANGGSASNGMGATVSR